VLQTNTITPTREQVLILSNNYTLSILLFIDKPCQALCFGMLNLIITLFVIVLPHQAIVILGYDFRKMYVGGSNIFVVIKTVRIMLPGAKYTYVFVLL